MVKILKVTHLNPTNHSICKQVFNHLAAKPYAVIAYSTCSASHIQILLVSISYICLFVKDPYYALDCYSCCVYH